MLVWQHTIERENRTYDFCTYNQRPSEHFFAVKQEHTDIWVNAHDSHELFSADALFVHTDRGDQKMDLGIKTADCLPIALIHQQWIAMIHAGRKGLELNILSKIPKQLKEACNLSRSPLVAIIGPHICQEHYPVDQKSASCFSKEYYRQEEEQYFLKLQQIATAQLSTIFAKIQIVTAPQCTYEEEKLHSFRRNKTSQRNFNVLSLRSK